ncbi:hypothetical protein HZS_2081 [Henneguya salminicola]|nr:hypothetical protein HZS_2081 [Henneguya salminicola]
MLVMLLSYYLFLYGLCLWQHSYKVEIKRLKCVKFLLNVKNGLIFALILMDFQINIIELICRCFNLNITDICFGLNYKMMVFIQQISMLSSYFFYLSQVISPYILHFFWKFNISCNIFLICMVHLMKICFFSRSIIYRNKQQNLNWVFINILIGIMGIDF